MGEIWEWKENEGRGLRREEGEEEENIGKVREREVEEAIGESESGEWEEKRILHKTKTEKWDRRE